MPIRRIYYGWKCKLVISPSQTHVLTCRLLEYGGIYLDIDTFIVRPFAPYGLMRQDVVLGMEAHPLNPALMSYGPGSDDGMHPKGLCNGVIIARPGAEFLRRWMTTYEEAFDSSYWEYNSVVSCMRS